MQRQLILLDEERRDWRMDNRTIEVGRQGIQAARDVLSQRRATAERQGAARTNRAA